MEFGSSHCFLPRWADSEDFFEDEIADGIANCAAEQAVAWKLTAEEDGVEDSNILGFLRRINEQAARTGKQRSRAGAMGTESRIQPRAKAGASHHYDRKVAERTVVESKLSRSAAEQKLLNKQAAEAAEAARLLELGLESRDAEEHDLSSRFGSVAVTDWDDEHAPVIIEVGSGFIRAGFAGDDSPKAHFPAIVGRCRHQGVMVGMAQKNAYVGDEAQSKRGVLTLKYPIQNGAITNFDDFEKLLFHAFYNELRVAPEEHPVLIADSGGSEDERARLAQILFETFSVPALHIESAQVLALFSTGRSTGLVLMVGDNRTDVVPVYEGYVLQHAAKSVELGGRDIDDFMAKILTERGYAFTTCAERDIIRDVRHKVGYAALDFEAEMQKAASSPSLEKSYELPDGQTISIGNERFRAIEALFSPQMLGREQMGLQDLVYGAIMACDVDIRKDLYANVVIAGGLSQTNGLTERVQRDLTALAPSSIRVKCTNAGHYGSWTGGSLLASLSTFDQLWITQLMWDETGPAIVSKMCLNHVSDSNTKVAPVTRPAQSETQAATNLPSPPPSSPKAAPKQSNQVVETRGLADSNSVLLLPGALAADPSAEVTTAPPTQCNECSAVFASCNPTDPKAGTWACLFCGAASNPLPSAHTPSGSLIQYVLSDEQPPSYTDVELEEKRSRPRSLPPPMVVFCVDVSGSMSCKVSTHTAGSSQRLTRIDCVKAAVCAEIAELAKTDPDCVCIVITFGTGVRVVGDGGQSMRVSERLNGDFPALVHHGENLSGRCREPVKTSSRTLCSRVQQIGISGSTALGPALAVALGLTRGSPGSRVVLCTDGEANQGVGAMNATRPEEFYTDAAHIAREHSVSVSIIGVEGAEINMELLGTVADITGGKVDIVDPTALGQTFGAALGPEVVATGLNVALQLPSARARWLDEHDPLSGLSSELGNATATTTISAAFTLDTDATVPEGTDLGEPAPIPYQVRLKYRNAAGAEVLRVMTAFRPVTADRGRAEGCLNAGVVGLTAIQRASRLAQSNQYLSARILMISTLRLLQRGLKTTAHQDDYISYIVAAEKLDQFMREAQARDSLFGTQNRDDQSSKALFQMKTLGITSFRARGV